MIPEDQLKPCKHLLLRIPHLKITQKDEFDVLCKLSMAIITPTCLVGPEQDVGTSLPCKGYELGVVTEIIRRVAFVTTLT